MTAAPVPVAGSLQRGVALIAVRWIVAALSIIVTGLVQRSAMKSAMCRRPGSA